MFFGAAIASPTVSDPEADRVEMMQLMLAGLSGMALFFSFGFFLAGMVGGISGMLIVASVLLTAGILMLGARAVIMRQHRRTVDKRKAESNVRCEYCGGSSPREQHRCQFCGAPLW